MNVRGGGEGEEEGREWEKEGRERRGGGVTGSVSPVNFYSYQCNFNMKLLQLRFVILY